MTIEAIQAVSAAQGVVDQAGVRPDELQNMSQDFNEMMAHDPQAAQYNDVHAHEHGSTAVSHFVQSQEQVMRQTFDDVRSFTVQAPHMDVQSMVARQIELSYQISMVQVQFNSGVYVAQSGKSGMQTLMKNQ